MKRLWTKSNVFWLWACVAMLLQVTAGAPRLHSQVTEWERALAHFWQFGFTGVVFFGVSALLFRSTTGLSLANAGWRLGDLRMGLRAGLLGLAVIPGLVWISSHDPEFLAQYPQSLWPLNGPGPFALWALGLAAYYIGWEFFFRGYLLQGLSAEHGAAAALWIQTALSTIIHLGKPTGELIGALPGGLIFGWLALRTNSLLAPTLLHWLLGVLNFLFCAHQLGAI